MDNVNQPRIQELLNKYSSIGIVVSKNPTVDQMASALSLFLTLRSTGKTVIIASPTPPSDEISHLAGVDKVQTELRGEGGDLTVSFPYNEGEIEKVSYTLENGLLNIVVKAGEKGLQFHENDIQYKRSGKAPELLFFIGVSRLSDLESLFNPEVLKDTIIVNIDNKSDNQGFGELVQIHPQASSLSEQIAHLIHSLQNHEISLDAAQNLLFGIMHATGDFQDPKTTPLAFEMAGRLMQKGAVRKAKRTQMSEIRRDQDFATQSRPRNPFMPNNMRPQPFTPRPQAPRPQSPFQPAQSQAQPMDMNEQSKSVPPQRPQRPAPPDWLTPKVYKGSSNIL